MLRSMENYTIIICFDIIFLVNILILVYVISD